jgi:hypothetical protein
MGRGHIDCVPEFPVHLGFVERCHDGSISLPQQKWNFPFIGTTDQLPL